MPPPNPQAAQAGLAIAMAPTLNAAVGEYDPAQPDATFPRLAALIAALVRRYGSASGTLAARQYAQQRAAAGVPGPYRARPAPLPSIEQISRTLGWATAPYADPAVKTPAPIVHDRVLIAAERLVLDVGRNTIVENTHVDRRARGWARITEPAPCAFCALLATRGAVYKSQSSAGFKTHDRCRCHPEPVFTAYEPSAQVRQWQADYAQATRGVHGMKNLQSAWRQAFDASSSTS